MGADEKLAVDEKAWYILIQIKIEIKLIQNASTEACMHAWI